MKLERMFMKMHYLAWVIVAMCLMMFGALYRGHQDIAIAEISKQSRIEGMAAVYKDTPIEVLTELHI